MPPASFVKTFICIYFRFGLDKGRFLWYIVVVKGKKIKARVNKDGLMGSASREHRVRKGKGSFRRRAKHKLELDK